MNESHLSRTARQREQEPRSVDLPAPMQKSDDTIRALKGESDKPELPQVASGGSYL